MAFNVGDKVTLIGNSSGLPDWTDGLSGTVESVEPGSASYDEVRVYRVKFNNAPEDVSQLERNDQWSVYGRDLKAAAGKFSVGDKVRFVNAEVNRNGVPRWALVKVGTVSRAYDEEDGGYRVIFDDADDEEDGGFDWYIREDVLVSVSDDIGIGSRVRIREGANLAIMGVAERVRDRIGTVVEPEAEGFRVRFDSPPGERDNFDNFAWYLKPAELVLASDNAPQSEAMLALIRERDAANQTAELLRSRLDTSQATVSDLYRKAASFSAQVVNIAREYGDSEVRQELTEQLGLEFTREVKLTVSITVTVETDTDEDDFDFDVNDFTDEVVSQIYNLGQTDLRSAIDDISVS